ncbi:MAG TPA: DNA-processing protein DprA [Blastocatellia bacterium]|nr:DNA-processing protein DprA [Blastocatellia bacterium]
MRTDLADWIALNMVRRIGPRTANLLLDSFGPPASVFAASRHDLISAGLKPDTISELHSSGILDKANAEIERLDQIGARVVTIEDDDYPPLLREIYDPPIVLYVRGDLRVACERPCLAVVGSRRCSTYGINASQSLARALAEQGIVIVSGLARGIDAAAHRGALEVQGVTIGVIGTGLDVTYPKEHARLTEEIIASGTVITEFPLGTPPLAQNFPYRNRILSGLCFGVLIVEAAEHSGSLITARMAYEQGREVFAVPGNITSQTSFGPNYLIKDGAKLVQHWRDILEELPREWKERICVRPVAEERKSADTELQPAFEAVALTETEQLVLDLLSPDVSSHIDQLLMASGLKSADLMNALLGLEMKDRIRQLPGKSFVRRL